MIEKKYFSSKTSFYIKNMSKNAFFALCAHTNLDTNHLNKRFLKKKMEIVCAHRKKVVTLHCQKIKTTISIKDLVS